MGTFSKRGKTVAALAIGSLTLGLISAATPAQADPAPRADDIVGVGSDTLQYMLDFGADGDYNGANGYNTAKNSRLISIDATPDANARAGYLNGSTSAAQLPLNPTVVLRGGTSPVQRPNGSGAGIFALAKDTTGRINFARSSSALSQGDVNNAKAADGVGDLHEVRLAKDTLSMAVGTVTNAVPMTAAQLKAVYECTATKWTDVGGTSTQTIIPILPQAGSGTRKTFLTNIGFTVDASGNVTEAPGSCVKTFEENDPYALFVDDNGVQVGDPYVTGLNPNPDAVEPISGGRLKMYQNGYFTNPNTAVGKATKAGDDTVLQPKVSLLSTATTGTYNNVRGLYVIFRDADITSTDKFNGSNKNWVNTLFLAGAAGGTPFFNQAAGKSLLTSAGVTPAFADCGVNPTNATPCGP